ncbi:MAG: Lrp/AsnC family transcriptional regulator [Pseudomonadota bacterium]
MTHRPLDEKDLEILRHLQDDAWITHTALGEIVHLSASAVQRRIRRLQSEGVITGAKATVDPTKTQHRLRVYLLLELHDDGAESLEAFEKELAAYPEITRVDRKVRHPRGAGLPRYGEFYGHCNAGDQPQPQCASLLDVDEAENTGWLSQRLCAWSPGARLPTSEQPIINLMLNTMILRNARTRL